MAKDSNFFEGLVLGAILGGIAGVLFAPDSGRETRRKLQNSSLEKEDLVDTAKDQTENMIEKTKDAIESGFAKLKDLIEENKKEQARN